MHELARDFELIDVWRVPIDPDSSQVSSFPEIYDFLVHVDPAEGSRLAWLLVETRFVLGKFFRLDGGRTWIPIPGTHELSLRDRLTMNDKEKNRAAEIDLPVHKIGQFQVVYLFENESLVEISNRTIYALLHVGLTAKNQLWMGVYVKSRGTLSNIYMLIIRPFRHVIIYPAWLKLIEKKWRDFQLSQYRLRSIRQEGRIS